MNCATDIKALSKSIEILSDYKRVLKENEELTISNKEIDKECSRLEEKEIKLINENEHYKDLICVQQKEIETIKYENKTLKNCVSAIFNETFEEEYISKKEVEDKIEEYKKMSDEFYIKFLESNRYDAEARDKGIGCDAIVKALQELLEGRI